jgi:hypothetical protein
MMSDWILLCLASGVSPPQTTLKLRRGYLYDLIFLFVVDVVIVRVAHDFRKLFLMLCDLFFKIGDLCLEGILPLGFVVGLSYLHASSVSESFAFVNRFF